MTDPMPTTPPLPTLKPRGFLRGTEFLHETFFMQSPDPTIAMTLVSLEDAQAAILADRRSRAPEGLSVAQEPKYTVNGSAIVNRASGEAIPSDEPVFIFRARDVHAREALESYACVLTPGDHRDAVCQRIADFAKFACAHPERMKEPDTATPTGEAS